jgi:sec-independent protein translocase protein TatA
LFDTAPAASKINRNGWFTASWRLANAALKPWLEAQNRCFGFGHSHLQSQVACMFGLGPLELIIFGVIILVLFGNRLPSVMRSLGQGLVEFKKGVQGVEDDKERSQKS